MQDQPVAQNAESAVAAPEPALPLRSDTILGVCEAVGQDLGFNPIYLRLVFAALFYLNPLMVTGTYLALGAGVAVSRWLYPAPASAPRPLVEAQAHPADNVAKEELLAA